MYGSDSVVGGSPREYQSYTLKIDKCHPAEAVVVIVIFIDLRI